MWQDVVDVTFLLHSEKQDKTGSEFFFLQLWIRCQACFDFVASSQLSEDFIEVLNA